MTKPQQIGLITGVIRVMGDNRVTVSEVQEIVSIGSSILTLAFFGGFLGKMVRTMAKEALGPRKKEIIQPVISLALPATESNYYTISFQGDTVFKTGDLVSEKAFKAENERVAKLGLRPSRGWVSSKGELLSRGNGGKEPSELEEYLPNSIPAVDLHRIADKYSWWAARLAEAVCPHNDVACVEREAKRLYEVVRQRMAT